MLIYSSTQSNIMNVIRIVSFVWKICNFYLLLLLFFPFANQKCYIIIAMEEKNERLLLYDGPMIFNIKINL